MMALDYNRLPLTETAEQPCTLTRCEAVLLLLVLDYISEHAYLWRRDGIAPLTVEQFDTLQTMISEIEGKLYP